MKIASAFCLVFFAGLCAHAQSLTLEQARTLALANSRSLARHGQALRSIALDERARVYQNLPSLSLGASGSMGLWSQAGAPAIENPLDTFSAGASFGVSQRIFDGGRTSIQKAINEIASQSARLEAMAEFFNVIDSADNAFYAVLEAEATLEAEISSLEVARATLSIAEIRLSTGMINQGEHLRALADMVARENAMNQARRNVALQAARLRSLLGLSHLPPLEPVDFARYEALIERLGNISDEDADALLARLWQLIAASNPAYAQAGLSTRRAERNLSMALRGYAPTLSASFSTGLNLYPEFGARGGSLSISASIPIDFWTIANGVDRSRIALESSMMDYAGASVSLELDLQSALLNLFGFAGSALHTRLSLSYSERHFEFVEERYRLFQSSIAELNEAATILINSRNNNIRASYGFLQGLSRLRALGSIDDPDRLIDILMMR
ncbi:MAG: TolC family protein [Treponema sp.]|nr:TolC family protein [Treponema sp.]